MVVKIKLNLNNLIIEIPVSMNIIRSILVAQLLGPNIIPSDFLKDEVEDPKASLLNFSEHVPGFFVFP